jgi:hypothetical protein
MFRHWMFTEQHKTCYKAQPIFSLLNLNMPLSRNILSTSLIVNRGLNRGRAMTPVAVHHCGATFMSIGCRNKLITTRPLDSLHFSHPRPWS